jgi:hypothetical protein
MTETISPPTTPVPLPPIPPRPETDAAAVRAIEEASEHVRERAKQIRECPELHIPRLVLSKHVRGTSILDKIADAVNTFCGSISLQVSANRAQAASDRRAIADHETLIALHEMAKQQLDILNAQNQVLAILDNFASKDMPGKQDAIQAGVDQILATVRPQPSAG